MRIIRPADAAPAYTVAAEAFRGLWKAVTGEALPIGTDWGEGPCVLIGADDVLPAAANLLRDRAVDTLGIRYGTDDYCIRSAAYNGQSVLLLAGGRGRSTLYAVYDYFARAAGVRYYWDGDAVPQHDALPLEGWAVQERPRFDYRGLRYFAHRSLARFQAEHWGLADWKREIDWMCKRRLNYFMLRIGHDDVFQRAFPELVPYPDPNAPCPEYDPDSMPGYDDRTVFWSLEYRSKLRKMVLDYAFERDLIHSEDCGTMTHWYSRTPKAYLDAVKPEFVPQTTAGYRQPTGLVWDIRKSENLDRYFKLTEAYVENYGRPELFHTIGLAERMCYEDRTDNLRLKLFTYRQIARRLRDRWPDSKLLIASWDFVMYWKPDEVRKLVDELDPERTLILDYTSENPPEDTCFKAWGFWKRFPWIFGIFHAYESEADMRGDYALIDRRLRDAAEDPYCRGMILWPELSHSDTLMLEYFTDNAWSPRARDVHALIADLCRGRYGADAGYMNGVWEDFFPLLRLTAWSHRPGNPLFGTNQEHLYNLLGQRFVMLRGFEDEQVLRYEEALRFFLSQAGPLDAAFPQVLSELAALSDAQLENPFLRRDAIDLARALVRRRINSGLERLEIVIRDSAAGRGDLTSVATRCDALLALVRGLGELLACSEEFSLAASLSRLSEEAPVNPCFEKTLRRNASCGYCRTQIAELFPGLYLPAMERYFDFLRALPADPRTAERPDWAGLDKSLMQAFIDAPLPQLSARPLRAVLADLVRLTAAVDYTL